MNTAPRGQPNETNTAPRGQRPELNAPRTGSSGERSGESGAFIIAIDGPSGTGKSTVARRVAAELGAGYLDTGAMYRMVTLAVLRAGADPVNDNAVVQVLEGLSFTSPLSPGHQSHQLDHVDVTDEIRGQ